MEGNTIANKKNSIPGELIKMHYLSKFSEDFGRNIRKEPVSNFMENQGKTPTLYTAKLPEVLDWLHEQRQPGILEEKPCITPLLLYDKLLSTKKILFHYEGNPESANLIRKFVDLFEPMIKDSCAIIISPSFTPKSRMREEQELIELIRNSTMETSFIKFNFNRIGDFWSYAVKHDCTLLVTTKNFQADLAKVLFHFYKGGMWYDRLSFYLA